MAFPKYVDVNTHNIELAVREGIRPMQRLFDEEHEQLPFFGNMMAGGDYFGNRLHASYSISHIPGRWLNALINVRDTFMISPNKSEMDTLRFWAYESLDAVGMGLPCCIDLQSYKRTKIYDLHNLREVMHAFNALIRYDGDEHASMLANTLIRTIREYYDFEHAGFQHRRFLADRGGTRTGFLEPEYTFPMAFGRYIGPLVKLFRTTENDEALEQAQRLKAVCFRYLLNENGTYDPIRFGYHTHSTTSMISSLAQLGELTKEKAVLDRVAAFMHEGLNCIALDFGWCIEFYDRRNLGGEINNTTDIVETYLILGKAGYAGCFDKAELILRSHLLPSQLLDTGFITDTDNINNAAYARIADDARGAFGFPCPYGHEYEPGSPVSFNWDIVGGAVGGLCEVWKSIVTETADGLLSVNMLFSYADHRIQILDPYSHNGTLTITTKRRYSVVRIRLSDSFDRDQSIIAGIDRYWFAGEYVYLADVKPNQQISIKLQMKEVVKEYRFRDHRFRVAYKGQQITGMTSKGKRLCFFREIE